MAVWITAIKKGNTLVSYPIDLRTLNYPAQKDEFISLAQQNLVEDGYATNEELEDITFQFDEHRS